MDMLFHMMQQTLKSSCRSLSKLQYSLSYRSHGPKSRQDGRKDQLKIFEQDSYGISKRNREMRLRSLEQSKKELPQEKQQTFLSQHLVYVTLFMKHDCWKSQYVYLIMNFEQIGFRKISDSTLLDQASYSLGLRETQPDQRYPALKFVKPVTEPLVRSGIDNILQVLDTHRLLKYDLNHSSNPVLEQFFETEVVPNLQRMFWHPRLTIDHTLHFDIESHFSNAINYAVIGTIFRNLKAVASKVAKNLYNIYKHKEDYECSHGKLTKAFMQLGVSLQKNEYFGGNHPCHIDFYFLAVILPYIRCEQFESYLKADVGSQLWSWVLRMKSITEYNKDRLTILQE